MTSWHSRTDVGLKRKNNEDHVHVDPKRGLAVVADGMGGHSAGEVASHLAVEAIASSLGRSNGFWPFRRRSRERADLLDAVRLANERVFTAGQKEVEHRGMGTTVVVLWICAGSAHVAHVGDSRLYRLRGGVLESLTRDHSMASVDGLMRHVLTRAVGIESEVEIDYRRVEVEKGDVFLLCSDGLCGVVDEGRISTVLSRTEDGEAAAEALIALAHSAGAPDNVTVALAYC